jgi:hypothetical protein
MTQNVDLENSFECSGTVHRARFEYDLLFHRFDLSPKRHNGALAHFLDREKSCRAFQVVAKCQHTKVLWV